MIYSLAQSTGWSLEYIIWNLSLQQILLITEANRVIYDTEDNDTVKIEDLPPEEQEKMLSQIFGGDAFKGG